MQMASGRTDSKHGAIMLSRSDAAFDASQAAKAIVRRLRTSLTPRPMPSRYHPRWPLTCVHADGVWTH